MLFSRWIGDYVVCGWRREEEEEEDDAGEENRK